MRKGGWKEMDMLGSELVTYEQVAMDISFPKNLMEMDLLGN